MQKNEHHIIAREGWWILFFIIMLGLFGQAYLGLPAMIILLILFVVAGYIFRNPVRNIPSSPLSVVSPISGRLLSIDETEDKYLSRKAIRYRIRISFWDVHAMNCPVEGKVMKQWSSKLEAVEYNRSYTYWIQTDEGDDIVFSLLLGKWSPFTRMLIRSGERVGQGQACGFLYYTGMIEIYMPENSKIVVEKGTHLSGGEDILGKFVHENGASVIGK